MTKKRPKGQPPPPIAPDPKRRYTHEFTSRTPGGLPFKVLYRRVPVRDGFDIEAAIISLPAAADEKDDDT